MPAANLQGVTKAVNHITSAALRVNPHFIASTELGTAPAAGIIPAPVCKTCLEQEQIAEENKNHKQEISLHWEGNLS